MMGKIGGCLPPPPLGTETEKLVYVVNQNSLERAALGGYGASWSTEGGCFGGGGERPPTEGALLQALDIELESSPHHGAVLVPSLNYQAARRSERAARSDGVSCQIRKRAGGLVLQGDQIGKVNPSSSGAR